MQIFTEMAGFWVLQLKGGFDMCKKLRQMEMARQLRKRQPSVPPGGMCRDF